jgi:uncharacterized protein YbaA (DUF1428 family)
MAYVDGFVIPIKKSKLKDYKKMALLGKKMWMKYGALDYAECIGDDLKVPKGFGKSFLKLAGAKAAETVIFAFITYKSKAHRNAVNKRIHNDPGMSAPPSMPFDIKRMTFGGFKVVVKA